MMHEPPEERAGTNVYRLGDYPRRLAALEGEVQELRRARDAMGPLFRQAAILGGALRVLEDAFGVPPGNGVIDVLVPVGDHVERIGVNTDAWPHDDPETVLAALQARPCGA